MAKIGSGEWFSELADKLIDVGISHLEYKTSIDSTTRNTTATPTTMTSGLQQKLPYILGGLALVGIVVILAKR